MHPLGVCVFPNKIVRRLDLHFSAFLSIQRWTNICSNTFKLITISKQKKMNWTIFVRILKWLRVFNWFTRIYAIIICLFIFDFFFLLIRLNVKKFRFCQSLGFWYTYQMKMNDFVKMWWLSPHSVHCILRPEFSSHILSM